jgi:hypothetical protein
MLNYYAVHTEPPTLKVLESRDVVQRLKWILDARSVTPGRIYYLFLRITQVLRYISRITDTPTDRLASWTLVCEIRQKSDHSELKRRRARTRLPPTFHLLTEAEFDILRDKSTHRLYYILAHENPQLPAIRRLFLGNLLVLTLVTVPPPRSQVFRLMRLGEHLKWNGHTYEITMDGQKPQLKNGKSVYLIIPPEVGVFYTRWIEVFLGGRSTGLVFPSSRGGVIRKLNPIIYPITEVYLQKEVPISKFR